MFVSAMRRELRFLPVLTYSGTGPPVFGWPGFFGFRSGSVPQTLRHSLAA
jgi:hypothetical protein